MFVVVRPRKNTQIDRESGLNVATGVSEVLSRSLMFRGVVHVIRSPLRF
jgi:hypothetical protein